MKPDGGDWMNESIFPATVKERLNFKYRSIAGIFYGDMDNDGTDDLVVLATPKQSKNIISGEDVAHITKHEVCDITTTSFDCYDERNNIEIYSIKDNISSKSYNMTKNKWKSISDGFGATETRRREFYEKPTAMRKRKDAAAADFNGDGVIDIFASDVGTNTGRKGNINRRKERFVDYCITTANGIVHIVSGAVQVMVLRKVKV